MRRELRVATGNHVREHLQRVAQFVIEFIQRVLLPAKRPQQVKNDHRGDRRAQTDRQEDRPHRRHGMIGNDGTEKPVSAQAGKEEQYREQQRPDPGWHPPHHNRFDAGRQSSRVRALPDVQVVTQRARQTLLSILVHSVRSNSTGLILAILSFAIALQPQTPPRRRPPEYTFRVIAEFPHDPAAFTQGLAYQGGFLYEGTGLRGRSSVRKVQLETGTVVQRIDLSQDYFGEGIALWKNLIFELTWQSEVGFVYDARSFTLLRRFSYKGEGWGLTTNGRELYMSDGSDEIRILDPTNFAEKRRLKVHDAATPIRDLNELEFVEGEIFANVWHTDRIARISPVSGKVLGWIDLAGLLSPIYRRNPEAVLNGIAYDPEGKRLFVTGKLWPKVFQIKIVPKA